MSGDDDLAKRLLQKADRILKEVDEAYIIKQRGHHQRAMPTFRPEELSLGKTLGTGGFGIVSEISKFSLDPDEPSEELPVDTEGEEHPITLENPQQPNNNIHPTVSLDDAIPGTFVEVVDRPEELTMNDHVHYDVKKAREFMANRCMRNGKARYAIKRLHKALTPVEKARGMIDLAIEAKYLSTVWHPNIIKLRGVAKGDMVDPDFFIIIDRLYMTLDVHIKEWAATFKSKKGSLFGIGKDKDGLKGLLIDRLTVAYDLAAAFFYLHENR
ncbi:hypothetical protein FisN_4Lh157 [Fistulifera solaris]|uniref:Protein kinase domain-containing protein n=1 Tax=Fistulifera solaris TaxID=1519565 RepID=A0A1Z5JZJ6_FISSO|nr:hypothetical protein FisN_4Lh157 [Fistulifera solaris]|eukprot:GAX19258.1 hypothetical protein FisN_4Lh157 [Fistulifera solaris]